MVLLEMQDPAAALSSSSLLPFLISLLIPHHHDTHYHHDTYYHHDTLYHHCHFLLLTTDNATVEKVKRCAEKEMMEQIAELAPGASIDPALTDFCPGKHMPPAT